MKSRDWMAAAECRDHDPELFFPNQTGNGARQAVARAAVVCRSCPVVVECGQYARSLNVPFGVWGGSLRAQGTGLGGNRPLAPHGTEAAAARHYRKGEKPCGPCLDAAAAAHRQRKGRTA